MSQQDVHAVANRLSLRPPQKDSLQILHKIFGLVDFEKDTDPVEALEAIQGKYPHVEDFERAFPSLCFSLATGVGKTRLMGAFIAYLYRAHEIRNFFVLAPNLTIYNKLIADFTPNTPKYVFQGIGEFARQQPEIITGDNYESGRGVAENRLFDDGVARINVFNISKINAKATGTKTPKIKRLSEYIGESYFDYLSSLPDLVMLMDESHRYRAKAGMRAIDELRPIVGLELTATPIVPGKSKDTPFKNVIYDYPLAKALDDGFVKSPAVATRTDFKKGDFSEEQIERIKLEDGVRLHEETKVHLDVYARETGQRRVKPFVLIVAKDTAHASALKSLIELDDFFGGDYAGKVIEIHSATKASEEDEYVSRLLAVENPDEPTEVVIHVNKLGEGWDVTNLYTIIPLRAFNARTLIEQAMGRGLRLPYGRKVGVTAVDRLTIVAHDKFQEIVDEARRGDSILNKLEQVVIDEPGAGRPESVIVPSQFEEEFFGDRPTGSAGQAGQPAKPPEFEGEREKVAGRVALDVLRKSGSKLKSLTDLSRPEVKRQIAEETRRTFAVKTDGIPGLEEVDIEAIVEKICNEYPKRSIDIPRVVITPSSETTYGFSDFDLVPPTAKLRPIVEEIRLQDLKTGEREHVTTAAVGVEARLEDEIVSKLITYDDIAYDDHAGLLYKLAGQMVDHLRGDLEDEDDVRNVVIRQAQNLATEIYAQLQEHYFESETTYEATVSANFQLLEPQHFVSSGDPPRDFRKPVDDKSLIRNSLFFGFTKSVHPVQKFDSDSERRFSVLLEGDKSVLKWTKPGPKVFRIYWQRGMAEGEYEPDFVVVTADGSFLCETKMRSQLDTPEVIEKARAAAQWCREAAEATGQSWRYLLVPHDTIDEASSFRKLASDFGHGD